jgi:hypothetical protein
MIRGVKAARKPHEDGNLNGVPQGWVWPSHRKDDIQQVRKWTAHRPAGTSLPGPFMAGELRLIVDAIVMPISHRTVEDGRTTGPCLRRAREADIDLAVWPASHTDYGVVGWELVQLAAARHLHSVSSAKIQATRDGGRFRATRNGTQQL